jgi:hypothetical protein
MNKTRRMLIVVASLLSPILVGFIVGALQPAGSIYGLIFILATFFGVPFIGVTGLVIATARRNQQPKSYTSLLGYVIPAVLVCSCEIIAGF